MPETFSSCAEIRCGGRCLHVGSHRLQQLLQLLRALCLGGVREVCFRDEAGRKCASEDFRQQTCRRWSVTCRAAWRACRWRWAPRAAWRLCRMRTMEMSLLEGCLLLSCSEMFWTSGGTSSSGLTSSTVLTPETRAYTIRATQKTCCNISITTEDSAS